MASVERLADLYVGGRSIPEISDLTGVPRSTIRHRLSKVGVLRSRGDGVRLAAGKISSTLSGRARAFTDDHKRAISVSRRRWSEKNAAGVSIKPSGYVELTRGQHKGRSEHVVLMEEHLGRRLRQDEVVHHIDHNKANNELINLALMTRADHTRLHRLGRNFSQEVE